MTQELTREQRIMVDAFGIHPEDAPHTPDCTDDWCVCPDDVVWGRLLGDADPAAPGKDWVSAAFGPGDYDVEDAE